MTYDNPGFVADTPIKEKPAVIPAIVIMEDDSASAADSQKAATQPKLQVEVPPTVAEPIIKMPVHVIPKSPPPTPEGYTVAEHYKL